MDNTILLQLQQFASLLSQQTQSKPAEQDTTIKFNKVWKESFSSLATLSLS